MKKRRKKKLLQVSLGICALFPIVSGLLGMSGVNNPIYDEAHQPAGVLLDSNLRFLNGLSVGVGLCTLFIIPGIKSRTGELRIICAAIFLGAVGRMLSIASYGLAPSPFHIVGFVELAIPPLLVYWQSRISG